jgi:hypothetical protein
MIRLRAYVTHNPNLKILGMVKIYSKTKRQLENAVHKEIEKMGYSFYSQYGIKTEWFKPNKEFAKQLNQNGLNAFNACKNRHFIKWDA